MASPSIALLSSTNCDYCSIQIDDVVRTKNTKVQILVALAAGCVGLVFSFAAQKTAAATFALINAAQTPAAVQGSTSASSADSNSNLAIVLCAATITGTVGLLIGLAFAWFARQSAASPVILQSDGLAYQLADGQFQHRVTSQEAKQMRRLVNSKDLDRYRQIMKGPSMEEVAVARAASSWDEEPSSPVKSASGSVHVDEVVDATKANLASRKKLTPKEVIRELQRGNGRFWMGLSQRPELNAMERRALIIAQAPSVCILGCADSRVPVEIVFDQGLGDIFVVRVAGNVVDDAAHGSIEYGVKHLGVKVLMVLGHEGCGAVKGAMTMSPADLEKEPAKLRSVLTSIKHNLAIERLDQITDHRAREREAVVVNCTAQMKQLLDNQVIADRVKEGTLIVCGAFYEITSGIVDFFSLDRNGLVTDL